MSRQCVALLFSCEVRGLDHAFFFTLRDSINFGDKDRMPVAQHMF